MRMRSVFSHTAQALAEGALIALLVVGLAAGTTFAAKGGVHGSPAGTATRTLSVSPADPSAWGTTFTISGTGFTPGSLVAVSMANPGCCAGFSVAADSTGAISFQSVTGAPGTYEVKLIDLNSPRLAVLADVKFDVY